MQILKVLSTVRMVLVNKFSIFLLCMVSTIFSAHALDHTFYYEKIGFKCGFKLYMGKNCTVFFPENDLAEGTVLTAADDFTVKKNKNRMEIATRNKNVNNTIVIRGVSGRSYKLNIVSTLNIDEHAENVSIELKTVRETVSEIASNTISYVKLSQIMINYNDEEKAKGYASVPQGVKVSDVRQDDNSPIVIKSKVWPGFILVQKKQFETTKFIGHIYEVFNTLERENYFDVRKIANKGVELATPTAVMHSPRGEEGSKSQLFVVVSELVKDQHFNLRQLREQKEAEEK